MCSKNILEAKCMDSAIKYTNLQLLLSLSHSPSDLHFSGAVVWFLQAISLTQHSEEIFVIY